MFAGSRVTGCRWEVGGLGSGTGSFAVVRRASSWRDFDARCFFCMCCAVQLKLSPLESGLTQLRRGCQ